MSEWKQARKKPVVVQFREVKEIEVSMATDGIPRMVWGEWTTTREGKLFAVANMDLIIKGVDGETYPIKKDIFAKTYDIISSVQKDEDEKK